MKHNKWTILEKLKGGKCIAMCDCGTRKEQWTYNITSGKSTQCSKCQSDSYKTRGIHYDIGGTSHPLYNVWSGIKRRCYNKKQKSYKYYGAKGVTMCEEWRNDYRKFYEWMMSNGYKKGMVCSRHGDVGNYEPSNCSVKSFSENAMEVDMSSVSTVESRKQQSLRLSSLKEDEYALCLQDCKSGRYKSNEITEKYGIDRHTILRMCRLYDIVPKWRKWKLTLEQIEEVKNLKSLGMTNKEIGDIYGMSHEGIRILIMQNS